jgi:hypothetical protein
MTGSDGDDDMPRDNPDASDLAGLTEYSEALERIAAELRVFEATIQHLWTKRQVLDTIAQVQAAVGRLRVAKSNYTKAQS